MKKILSGLQYYDLQEEILKTEHIQHNTLLERMASSFVYGFRRLCNEFPSIYHTHPEVLVFAGPGSKGALALYIANQLRESGYEVRTYLFYQKRRISEVCNTARQQVLDADLPLEEVIDSFSTPFITPTNIIIDGLFGVDITTAPSEGFDKLIQFLNTSGAPIVSIDIPSGLYPEDNSLNDLTHIIQANHTLTFYAPKLAFLFKEYARFVGQWRVIDMGVAEEVIQAIDSDYHLSDELSVQLLRIPRPAFSNKSDFGEVMLIGGKSGSYGRLALTARAALNTGCGEVTIHIPTQEGLLTLPSLLPEADLLLLPSYLDPLALALRSQKAVYAFDSTLELNEQLMLSLQELMTTIGKPMVLDLEPFYHYDHPRVILASLPAQSILLARPQDFDRLTKEHFTDEQRLQSAKEFAQEYDVIVVLKGPYSAICTPNQSVFFNASGNSGMATSGVGNVLIGIIASLLAQGMSSTTATIAGCFLLGQAGDDYVGGHTMATLTASNLIDNLYKVFRQID